jgi:hypothetical protein
MATPISATAVQQIINYYYLVSFCPPQHVGDLKKASRRMWGKLVKDAGLKSGAFADLVAPEVARRIVAFQQATRKPEQTAIQELTGLLKGADRNPEGAAAFQAAMGRVASHPGRAKAANRLHRQKGCAFCAAPCRYGYFTLMSEPDFKTLRAMLDAENQKLAMERNAVGVLWAYTRAHLWKVLGAREGYIRAGHLGNLSYCFLMLGTAKSRFALPEAQLRIYQALNQRAIRNLGATPINLVEPG